jgi:outer membrane usher protein
LEAERGLVNIGPGVDLRLPYGELSGAVAVSDANGQQGRATSVSYQYLGPQYGFSIGTQVFSGEYRRIGDSSLTLRPRSQRFASVSWTPIRRLALQASVTSMRQSDGSWQRNAGVSATYNLPGDASLLLGLTRSWFSTGIVDNDVQVNFILPIGRSSVGVNYSHNQGSSSLGVFAQRSLPSDAGFGYSLNAQDDSGGLEGRGELDYQNEYGRVSLTETRLDDHADTNLLLSGSLLALDGHVFATRPLDMGFALVQVPGIANVEITRENQAVGRTDANGNFLVPGLLPYQGNSIGLNQDTVPPQDAVAATEQMISVPRLGGTVVHFDVHVLRAVRGKVLIDNKPVEFGSVDVVIDGKSVHSPVGHDGSVYFSDVPEGIYVLTVQNKGSSVNCPLVVPPHKQAVFDAGALPCTH